MARDNFANLTAVEGIRDALQLAIELEHATIPVYLYTMYSLDQARNPRVFNLIRGVAKEEMAHFVIACNLLNAIGGTPSIDTPAFLVDYPAPLPGSVHTSVHASLAPFSREHVWTVFMEIEEPEHPLDFPTIAGAPLAEYQTIGDFYRAIRVAIMQAGDSIMTGDRARQLTADAVGLPGVIPVVDVDSANQAIEHIVEQGEGTTQSPTDENERLAHYYRFAEIYHERELIRDPAAPPDAPPDQRYRYAGAPIRADAGGVYPLRVNPKAAAYPAEARCLANEFNAAYTRMLGQLQAGFAGDGLQVSAAIDVMQVSLRPLAQQLVQMPLGDGTNAGPTFEYLRDLPRGDYV